MRNFLVTKSKKGASRFSLLAPIWLRGLDLNQRPLGYEPNELPDCSTPHKNHNSVVQSGQTTRFLVAPLRSYVHFISAILLRYSRKIARANRRNSPSQRLTFLRSHASTIFADRKS